MAEKWLKTDDLFGYRPSFKVDCRYCGVEMFLRFSMIYEQDYAMIQKFKCPDCGWFAIFKVDEDKDYQKKIFEMRGKRSTITPTMEQLSEDEKIRQQLEAFGYVGGRE